MTRWQSKEDPTVVICVLEDNNTVAVYNDGEENATVFHLTQDELEFNFTPLDD